MTRRSIGSGIFVLALTLLFSCNESKKSDESRQHYKDTQFTQEYSIKYELADKNNKLRYVTSDLNGVVQILSTSGLLKTYAGEFLYPGTLVPDKTYRPMADKKIGGLAKYKDQFVYVDDKAVVANAWAGRLYNKHTLAGASILAGGRDFSFLISDGTHLQYLQDSVVAWQGNSPEPIRSILYDDKLNKYWLLSSQSLLSFSPDKKDIEKIFSGENFTSFALVTSGKEIVIGTTGGYLSVDPETKNQKGEIQTKLPWTDITYVNQIDSSLWFGTTRGAFSRQQDGSIKYYASLRWLPSDTVVAIEKGPGHSILILTNRGLAKIVRQPMTLHEKAMYYEKQVRLRHIRHGFNATMAYMKGGSLATGSLEDSDNDGLWTSMYLGAEVFRYAVTKSPEALVNVRESMDAMERLYTINKIKGFPSRSFERRGYKYDDKAWRRAVDPEWDWKSTTSSDEAIGHIFVFGAMAELIEDQDLKTRAITLIDSLMQHTIDHDHYMVDWDGKPTTWGRWNPDYVNARPKGIGDRKINSSNYIAMLQTAYHFTKKEVYKDKAFELMTQHGYYENLMRPMKQIGKAADTADNWSKMLSESWNHSDDEMYFLGYWGLYRYALNDTLKLKFKEAILDHWESERPEKEGAWNILTALTGTPVFDLNEAVWYLKEYPMDLIHWTVKNSERKDITKIESNFREQSISEVLPAGELPVSRHNANRFDLDGGDGGSSEYSAGDIWLLPYWMGRYLEVISAPETLPTDK